MPDLRDPLDPSARVRAETAASVVGPGGATVVPERPVAPATAEPSPLQVALDRVGDRWSLLLVEALLDGPHRFNDLQSALPGIAPNVLTDRLRRLERQRVVVAAPYSQRPVRLSYELTAEGRQLAGALRLLTDWGARAGSADAPKHQTCGTPLEARWYCPTCARSVVEDEASELRRL